MAAKPRVNSSEQTWLSVDLASFSLFYAVANRYVGGGKRGRNCCPSPEDLPANLRPSTGREAGLHDYADTSRYMFIFLTIRFSAYSLIQISSPNISERRFNVYGRSLCYKIGESLL